MFVMEEFCGLHIEINTYALVGRSEGTSWRMFHRDNIVLQCCTSRVVNRVFATEEICVYHLHTCRCKAGAPALVHRGHICSKAQ